MTKRYRADSTFGMVASMSDAQALVEPPEYVQVPEDVRPFWDSIMLNRPASQWNRADLEIAANLARCKRDIEINAAELDSEGDIIENGRGDPILNPRHKLLEILSRRSVQLSRMLHVHAEAVVGISRNQVKKTQAVQAARERLAGAGDDLIPGENPYN